MTAIETETADDVVKELLDIQRLKNCFDCGICTASCSIADLLGQDYNPRGLLERIVLEPQKALGSDELWLCAWCYRCQERCPQALKLPEILLRMRKIAFKNGETHAFENALRKIVRNVPLPLVTTSVCFHPERAGMEQQKTLEKIEQLYEEFLTQQKAKRAQQVAEEKIAVVGSGPAGLTVAYELSLKGYGVTIFEALPEIGGMLRKCIPESRLPKHVLQKEIQYIRDLGVELKTGVDIGKDLLFSNLWREGYKAVFIGVGAHKNLKLRIDGTDLKGVIHALDFLWQVNSGQQVEVGRSVAVIGGGNVAMDAASTALKLGASDVTVLYRRSRDEMPAIPWEIQQTEHEGAKIEFLVSPKRILGEAGRVTGIECLRTQLGESDSSGRKKAVPIEGSEFTHKTDRVILAIGETPDLEFLPKDVELNEDGTLYVDPVTMETSIEKVFAGGDVVTGPATVIEAVRAGKHAAESIDRYLKHSGGT
jgi:NADPH-dependent glutamate synthase beta subunit-like oxidoreductase